MYPAGDELSNAVVVLCVVQTAIAGAEVEDQHCVIEYRNGIVTLHPIEDALCSVNGNVISDPIRLKQGK